MLQEWLQSVADQATLSAKASFLMSQLGSKKAIRAAKKFCVAIYGSSATPHGHSNLDNVAPTPEMRFSTAQEINGFESFDSDEDLHFGSADEVVEVEMKTIVEDGALGCSSHDEPAKYIPEIFSSLDDIPGEFQAGTTSQRADLDDAFASCDTIPEFDLVD